MPTPTQSIANAVKLYNEAAKGRTMSDGPRNSPIGGDFATLVKGAVEEAKKIGERGEKLSIDGIVGRADISQVVTAVAEAEVTLQTVVSIRDKVIDAYKDIIRMPM